MAVRGPRWRKTWQYLTGLPDQMRTRRWHRVLLLSALTGVITGLAIAGFDWLTARTILEQVFKLPRLAQAFAPGVGLVLAWAALRWLGNNASPSTSEEYLHAYHDPEHPLDPRPFPARVLASIATLGFGGAMGFEGPSIYMGAGIGSFLERRFGRYLTQDDLRLLLVAGAAAGVSAIFKAPATGAIFAIEVPFQEDTAAHALLPALIGSATSYLTYVAFYGTTPLFEISGQPHFDVTRLLGALGIGILAGLGARGFALGAAQRQSTQPPGQRQVRDSWSEASASRPSPGCASCSSTTGSPSDPATGPSPGPSTRTAPSRSSPPSLSFTPSPPCSPSREAAPGGSSSPSSSRAGSSDASSKASPTPTPACSPSSARPRSSAPATAPPSPESSSSPKSPAGPASSSPPSSPPPSPRS